MNRFEKVFHSEAQPHGSTEVKITTATSDELDPRPDLDKDHGFWVALLWAAKKHSQEIFLIFYTLRAGGANLARDKRAGLRILPGEWSAEKYAAFRDKHLRPSTQIIKNLLIEAARSDIKALTTRDEVISRIKALEPKLKDAGWSEQEIWAEKEFDLDGRRRSSVFASLLFSPNHEIGEITPKHIEFISRYPNGAEARTRLYRIDPALNRASPTEQAHLFAPLKKAAPTNHKEEAQYV